MKRYRMSEEFELNFSAEDLIPPEHRPMKFSRDSEATDTTPSYEVRQRVLSVLESEVTQDALLKRTIAAETTINAAMQEAGALERKLKEAKSLLLLSHDTIFRLMDNQDIAARELIAKIRFWLSNVEK